MISSEKQTVPENVSCEEPIMADNVQGKLSGRIISDFWSVIQMETVLNNFLPSLSGITTYGLRLLKTATFKFFYQQHMLLFYKKM